MVAEYKKVKIWASDPSLPVDGINRMVALMVESGVIKQAVTYEQIAQPVDPRIESFPLFRRGIQLMLERTDHGFGYPPQSNIES